MPATCGYSEGRPFPSGYTAQIRFIRSNGLASGCALLVAGIITTTVHIAR
jgi:hypothetical protein